LTLEISEKDVFGLLHIIPIVNHVNYQIVIFVDKQKKKLDSRKVYGKMLVVR